MNGNPFPLRVAAGTDVLLHAVLEVEGVVG